MIKKVRIFLFSLVFMFFIIPDVFAATLTSQGEADIQYSSSSGELGGSSNSRYNKKIDGDTAYCTSLHWNVPSVGTTYSLAAKTSNYNKDNYIAGQIIRIGKKKYSGKTEYMYIQEALTCFFSSKYGSSIYKTGDTHSYGFCNNNSKVKSLISTAKKYVDEYQFTEGKKTSTLPQLKIETDSQVISNVTTNSSGNYDYKSSNIKISGILTENYGGNRSEYYSSTVPSYTLKITGAPSGATVQLCNSSNQCYSNGATNLENGTYYLKITNGGLAGGSISVSLSGSNNSTYPSANLWDPKKSGKQILTTYVKSVDVSRSVSSTKTFSYAPANSYSVQLEKVDDTGAPLAGAKLKLYIADKDRKQIGDTLCSTDGDKQTYCSKNDIKEAEGYQNGNQLCYTEESSPSGYQKIDTECYNINLTESQINYYEYELQEDGTWKKTEIDNSTGTAATIFENYTKFSGEGVEKRNVYTLSDNTVVYDLADIIYEYKYVNSSGNTSTYYSTTSVTEEVGGIYRHGNVTQDEGGNNVYEFNDQVYRIPILNSSSAGGLKEVYAYLTDTSTNTYTILELDDGSDVNYHVKSPTETVSFVKEYKSNDNDVKKVCWLKDENGKDVVSDSLKYCDPNYYATKVVASNGSFHITVVNTLNSIKISKRAITGDEELPGATLSLYTANSDGSCKTDLVSSTNSPALKFTYKVYVPVIRVDGDEDENDATNTPDDTTDSTDKEDSSDTSGVGIIEKNYVKDGLSWVSTDAPVTISGLASGNYCLVENSPAAGYVKTTTVTKFTIDSDGNLDTKSISGESDGNTLIVRNQINNVSISKTDIVTTNELPGATLKICKADKDEKGEYKPVIGTGETGTEEDAIDKCVIAYLADGSSATWVSENEPHKISGLPAGTYALVEITAPNGYSTAETIYFMMNENGVLTDVNGKNLANNKIVMNDKRIDDVKTGQLNFYLVLIITIVTIGFVLLTYYHLSKKDNKNIKKTDKIRKRKIRKLYD